MGNYLQINKKIPDKSFQLKRVYFTLKIRGFDFIKNNDHPGRWPNVVQSTLFFYKRQGVFFYFSS